MSADPTDPAPAIATAAPAAVRVLLVDDQALVRAGIRVILESEDGIEVVGEAADGEEGVRLAAALAPDVICMDVQMPRVDGLEATRRIVADPAIRAGVLMLTTFDREDYLFTALEAGASGFVLKSASPESLVEAVHVIARGDALLSPDVTRRVIERFGRGSGPADEEPVPAAAPAIPADPRVQTLTDRELEVLRLLAEGLANAEIAERLYLGEATVKTHVSRLLLKLGVRDRVQAVVFAYERGIVVPGAS
ncbi:response regulator transcription factor [Clavibacter tessellarius]|uniref:DNA-binding response regulator n=1 Tax=Clavibacter tessellarius TaxID=31965 RepID=A0A225CIG7_9MICO|nr:response regulator transcription factor [Clavibacter michiganensis]OQJ62193.1 DNA-binding response regulator [Clavibacter michiganensis subsp. tessellarius]UKF34803.1 response regulator transcription factor [Clavibacter michiganensis subsp. tessellarius]